MKVILLNIFPKDYRYDNPIVQRMITVFEEVVATEEGEIIGHEFEDGSFLVEVSTEKAGKALQAFGDKLALAKGLSASENPPTPSE